VDLQVNYSAKQRVQAMAGRRPVRSVDLRKARQRPGKLIEILYAICQEQADKTGLKKEQFYDAIIGDCLEAAADALTQEIINFFPKRRREVFQKLVATAGKVQDKALELIETNSTAARSCEN
jgi:membrane-bound ClpP family serine protease